MKLRKSKTRLTEKDKLILSKYTDICTDLRKRQIDRHIVE